MIAGIVSTILFIVVNFRFLEKRLFRKRKKKIFLKVHIPISFALIVFAVIHIVFTFPFLKSRSILVLLTGLFCFLFILISFFCGIKRKFKIHRYTALLACLFLLLHLTFNILGLVSYQKEVKNISVNNIDMTDIPDGVYIGEYDVTYIFAKVKVTVNSNKITDITILEHRNERGKNAEIIIDEVLKQQQIDVDSISGATNSSIVLKKAVENALQNVNR